MPDHKIYVPQKQPVLTVPPGTVAPPSRPGVQTPTKLTTVEPKVLVKGTTTVPTIATVTVMEPTTKVIQVDRPVAVSTVPVTTMPTTIIASNPNHVIATNPITPGAFPEAAAAARPSAKSMEGAAATKASAGSRTASDGIENAEASFAEDLRSVSTKVGSSTDGGSTRGDRPGSKLDFESSQTLAPHDEAVDPAALDRYHREKFQDRYRYSDEDAAAQFRGVDRRRDVERDELGEPILDDLYEDPYSPISGDQFSFYDDADEGPRMDDLRRFYDDDESQLSGSIPIRRERGEFFASRGRYDDRDYDRPYQHYSSSVPARHQHQYLNDRDLDQPDWGAASETTSMSGYARETYPAAREYAPRPTLEDRERELEMIHQKTGAAPTAGSGPTRPPYDRRPGTAPGTAPGTVAHLRRRFSDQSVSDAGAPPNGVVSGIRKELLLSQHPTWYEFCL